MAGFACAAAVAIKVPELFGLQLEDFDQFYPRNFSLLVLPFLAGYLAWRRRLKNWALIAVPFAAAAALINAYPFAGGSSRSTLTSGPHWSDTEVLAALHLPILLWLVVGLAHAGGDWRSHDARMRFVRFTGEWLIYYGLNSARRRHLRRFHGRHLRGDRPQRRRVHRALACAVRSSRRRCRGCVAGRVETGRARTARPCSDPAVHPAVRRDADRLPRGHGPHRQGHRRRPGCADLLRRPAGADPRAGDLFDRRPRPGCAARPVRRAAVGSGGRGPPRRPAGAGRHRLTALRLRNHPPTG